MIHHHGFLSDYSTGDSLVHGVPAPVKMAVAALAVVVVATIHLPALVYFGIGVALVLVAVVGQIPPFFVIKRLLMLEPIVLGAAALALFQPNGGHIFALLVLRSSLCVATMVLLANTTPFAEMIGVLRRVKLPALLVTTVALMHRYAFVLGDEALRMRRARASRSFTSSRMAAMRAVGSVIGRLFVRANDRAERIYSAMVARGWE